MSSCIFDLYDYGFVKKCRVCKNTLLNSKFNKNKMKRDGIRSGCGSCCREYYYNSRDRLLNNMKNCNKNIGEKTNISEKNKRRIDFNFKLAHNIRVRTR